MELFYHRASKRTMCYRFLFFSILILFLFLIFSFQNLLVYEKPFYSTSIPSVFSNFDGIAKAISFFSVFMRKKYSIRIFEIFPSFFLDFFHVSYFKLLLFYFKNFSIKICFFAEMFLNFIFALIEFKFCQYF